MRHSTAIAARKFGAITIDWLVLSAAVLGIAVAAYTSIDTASLPIAAKAGTITQEPRQN